MKFEFKVGRNYYALGGFKMKVLSRSQKYVLGYIYCEDFQTTVFRKKSLFIKMRKF